MKLLLVGFSNNRKIMLKVNLLWVKVLIKLYSFPYIVVFVIKKRNIKRVKLSQDITNIHL